MLKTSNKAQRLKEMEKQTIRCSQEIFYTVAKECWELCRANLDKFTAFHALYTSALLTAKEQEIADAEALPLFSNSLLTVKTFVSTLRLVHVSIVKTG